MNINEFLALKVGDRISNPMSGTSGAVTGIVFDRRHEQEGVTLQWDGTAPDTARTFTKHTTAWMHWEREVEKPHNAFFAPGCCSAISPCAHQRKDPATICETCQKAAIATPVAG